MELNGKRALVLGVANEYSIAWAIARQLAQAGAQLAMTYQGERLQRSVEKLAGQVESAVVLPCDVTRDEDVEATATAANEQLGGLDIVVHSVAFARREELSGKISETEWEGFAIAQEVSAYSLLRTARYCAPYLEASEGGSILTLSYLGGERVIPNYNVMGLCKATLESAMRYLAAELGPAGIRVNALSAGPIKTMAARGISGFSHMVDAAAERAPLKRNVTADEVGKAAVFLLSDYATGITGETLYVDCGYHIMGM